jgi:hypothetical protein
MSLHDTLDSAMHRARAGQLDEAAAVLAGLPDPVAPLDDRDALLSLSIIHDLALAPVAQLGHTLSLSTQPHLLRVRLDLDRWFERWLDHQPVDGERRGGGAVAQMRSLAAIDRIPSVYRWISAAASLDEMRRYLAIEGGPDGGFDDLVALCQVGLGGRAKLELGRNYWDEMGRGDLAEVHTALHHNMATALDLQPVDRRDLPVEALGRAVLGPYLAANRILQPEMIGALGLIELQAGPRSREVARGLRRVGAPDDALPFYDEHAEADPRHGRAWLDEVVAPLEAAHPSWEARMARGARWRVAVNAQFFAWADQEFVTSARQPRAA